MANISLLSYFIGLLAITLATMVFLEIFVKKNFVRHGDKIDDSYYPLVFVCGLFCIVWPFSLPVVSVIGAFTVFIGAMYFCAQKIAKAIKNKITKHTDETA